MEVANASMEEMDVILSSGKDHHQMIDELEAKMQEYEPVDCKWQHVFVPGMYERTIFMPAGSLITSLVHKEKHRYNVSKGAAYVQINVGEWKMIEAPFRGTTEAGTRRVLYILSECEWTTYHCTNKVPDDESEDAILRAVDEIFDDLYENRSNPLLGGRIINNVIHKTIEQCPV